MTAGLTPIDRGLPGATTAPRERRHRSAPRWLRLVPAAVLVVLAVVGPMLVTHDPTLIASAPGLAPNAQNWFGTDGNGYDVFSRVMAAFRVDVPIGALAAIIASAAGILCGIVTGMNESRRGVVGLAAQGLSRFLDLFQAVPAIVIGLIASTLYGTSETALILIMAAVMFPLQAKLVRTETLKVKNEAYVDAARMAGFRELHLTIRNVLPNASWPAFEYAPILFGSALVLTAGLGFLGVGIKMPTPEWGTMLATGASDASAGRWWGFLFPGLALSLSIVAASVLFSGRQKD
ncbi:ABC transporter permease [Frondihabitans cladoniiphilus]|uniref:ABC transporter permease n=1 Tax=Frondihabitans cladoniiphilus TaxID=715785 RepID=A0ABP8W709_9MICO